MSNPSDTPAVSAPSAAKPPAPAEPFVQFGWIRLAWWYALYMFMFTLFTFLYRYRSWGRNKIPTQGPVLILSNHQSHLDPLLVGLAVLRRPYSILARRSLFENPYFGILIRTLNALPVERGAADIPAIRTCVDLLKRGGALMIFPEGTRTPDGVVHEFKEGPMLMIRRARPMVLPVAIEGAYDVWPRDGTPSLRGRIGVMVGDPIPAETLIAMGDGAMEMVRAKVEEMRLELAERMR